MRPSKRSSTWAHTLSINIYSVLFSVLTFWLLSLLYYLRFHGVGPQPSTAVTAGATVKEKEETLGKVAALVPPPPPPPPPSRPRDHVHVIFSTDCEYYQDWQTLVLFQSALIVGQDRYGPVTRIASGCSAEKQAELTNLYKALHPGLSFSVHFTPDFKHDSATNRKYAFYNKPWGLKHWLDHSSPPVPEDEVVVLLDPDMVFLRPITARIRGQQNNIHKRRYKPESLQELVSVGKPVAQEYGLGAPWTNDQHLKFNRSKVCPPGSPCLSTQKQFGEEHFSVGPPYLVVKSDMAKIAEVWTSFVPRVYSFYPYLLAEMYAYSMAAAHLDLPHFQMEHYMVSNTQAGAEGWPWVDQLADSCEPADAKGIFFPGKPTPSVLHFCQTFHLGEQSFYKGMHRDKFIDCHTAPMPSIPSGSCKIDLKSISFDKERERFKAARHQKRGGFALSILYQVLNATISHYQASPLCSPKA